MTLDLKSSWKRFGIAGRILSLLVVVYFLLLWFAPGSGFTSVLQFATILLALWILLRLARVGFRKAIWRLRNRLIVTYLLIAVVPILLILVLAGLGGYMLAAQVAVYIARNELDRTVASMQAATDVLKRADPKARPEILASAGEVYAETYPHINLLVADAKNVHRWGDDPSVDLPPKAPDAISGIVERNGRYFAWSYANQDNVKFLALTPLTRHFLSWMVPGLGDVYLLRYSDVSSSQATKPGKGVMQFNPRLQGEPAATVLPPPVNRFDIVLPWFSIVPAADWNDAAETKRALFTVHTRISALAGLLLSQRADELQVLPIVFSAVAIAFLVVEIVSLFIGVGLTRTITGAVHSLYEGTQRVMNSDFSHEIPVSGRDQIADLSSSFNTMTRNLERLLAVAKEKERLQAEIEIAREVQEQLYPKSAPALKTLRVTGMCQPARMVSGDYYDYQSIPAGKLAIAIGDVAGKGISAALLMATIQSAMRMDLRTSLEAAPAIASSNGFTLSTARLVSDLNQQLFATTSPEKFATFCIAIYDDETGMLTYTNAGHPPPLLLRAGDVSKLQVNGTVVGAFPWSPYGETQMKLQPGDLLVCYTDGITEPENEYGEMFGEGRLIEMIIKNSDREDGEIIGMLMDSVRQWTSSPELSDDMTVVIARKC